MKEAPPPPPRVCVRHYERACFGCTRLDMFGALSSGPLVMVLVSTRPKKTTMECGVELLVVPGSAEQKIAQYTKLLLPEIGTSNCHNTTVVPGFGLHLAPSCGHFHHLRLMVLAHRQAAVARPLACRCHPIKHKIRCYGVPSRKWVLRMCNGGPRRVRTMVTTCNGGGRFSLQKEDDSTWAGDHPRLSGCSICRGTHQTESVSSSDPHQLGTWLILRKTKCPA